MRNTPMPPMIVASFAAFYASSRSHGLKALCPLKTARTKRRPALFICTYKSYAVFVPTTSRSVSMHRRNFWINRNFVPALQQCSDVDPQELWYVPTCIIPHFSENFRFSVNSHYVNSVIFPVYLPLIDGLKATI